MGRTSTFLFPIPGRNRKVAQEPVRSDQRSIDPNSSKAQQFLGVGHDLNIDAPYHRNDNAWRAASRLELLDDYGHTLSQINHVDRERTSSHTQATFSNVSGLRGKASSTLLGKQYAGDGTARGSNASRSVQHEPSDSTLRSYYDKSTLPLAISQQTSASSVRDQALRKGIPPVIHPRHVPIQIDNQRYERAVDRYAASMKGAYLASEEVTQSKKKSRGVDFSRLWSRASRSNSRHNKPEDDFMSREARAERNRLSKLSSQTDNVYLESPIIQPGNYDRPPPTVSRTNSNHIADTRHQSPKSTMSIKSQPEITRGWDGQKIVTVQRNRIRSSQPMSAPPEEPIPPMPTEAQIRQMRTRFGTWDTKSTTSSRRTSNSILSDFDLRQKSVLSLSSDEDSDDDTWPSTAPSRKGETEIKSPLRAAPVAPREAPPLPSNLKQTPARRRSSTSKAGTVHFSQVQDGNYLTIPLTTATNSRLSGPWRRPSLPESVDSSEPSNSVSKQRPDSASSLRSIATMQSTRVMKVSKQEEALLSALREKRTMMKNAIIQEHETKHGSKRDVIESKPAISTIVLQPTVVYKQDADGNHVIGIGASGTQQTPHSMDSKHRPNSSIHTVIHHTIPETRSIAIDISDSEPSPDLSDFLSFGSDDDDGSTPRSSWLANDSTLRIDTQKDKSRTDSLLVMPSPRSTSGQFDWS